jgi:hypothetical protein
MTAVTTCWREAVANLLATPYRFALVALVLATTASYVGFSRAAAVHDEGVRAVQLRGDGRGVVVVTSRSGAVPAVACDRLAALGGVRAAGTLRQDGQVVVPTNPQSAYDAFTASPGMVHVLTVASATGSVLVGAATARELGLADGALLDLAGGRRQVTVLPERGARSQLVDRAVLTLVPAPFASGACYVELDSGGVDVAGTWLPATLGVPKDQLVLSPLLSGSSPEAHAAAASTTFGWLVLPAVPVVVWLLLARSRRPELALYSLSGARPAQVALLLWLELLPVTIVAAVLALAAVVVGAHRDGPAGLAGVRAAGLTLTVACAAVAACALATGFRRRGEYDLLRSSR